MSDPTEYPETAEAAEQRSQPTDAPREGERAHVSPGHLLRSERERKGLSLDELTAQTLLARSTVEALENNDFDRLSQPVFVRGYYRKCAKVLGLPENEIMDAYAEWTGDPGPRPAPPAQVDVVPQDVTPGNARAFGIILIVLIVLGLLAAVWIYLPDVRGLLAQGGDSSDIAITSPDTGAPGDEPTAASTSAPVESGGAASAAAADKTAPAAAADEPAGDGESAGADVGESPTSADNAVGGPQPVVGDSLRLQFDARSWVEVEDASGEVLLSGIVRSGQSRTVDGNPPYRVSLGYAPGVKMRFRGDEIDVSANTRDDNTARLTVGGD